MLRSKHLTVSVLLSFIFTIQFSPVLSQDNGPELSLYSIGKGHVVYLYHNGNDHYLSTDYSDNLEGYRDQSNWRLIFNSDGTVSFKNEPQGVCMEYNDDDWPVKQIYCDENKKLQKFNLMVTDSGALLILAYNGLCFNTNAVKKRVYTNSCDTSDPHFLWSLVAPWKGTRYQTDLR
jgi:cytolethal distending toxin subunit A